MLRLLLSFLIILSARSVHSHDWTYRVTSADGKDYFMWTPYVQNIRGILLTTKPNYIVGICGDSIIRKICKQEQIAIVAALNPSFGGRPTINTTIWNELHNGLKALANSSGYDEIEYAPICIHGHSTEGIAATRLAKYKPSRFWGVIQENSTVGETGLDSVPLLSFRGSEEYRVTAVHDLPWSATKENILSNRDNNELAHMVIQPGAGHFGWCPFKAQCIAKWLKK